MNTTAILLEDAQNSLRIAIQKLQAGDPLHAAFAAWLCQNIDIPIDVKRQTDEAASRSEDRTFKDVAVLGYARSSGVETREIVTALTAGLDWVTGRGHTINGQPAGFCSNGIALLGIALGVRAVADGSLRSKAAAWLAAFITHGVRGRMVPAWQQHLFAAAAHLLDVPLEPIGLDDPSTADARVSLRGLGALPSVSTTLREGDERNALQLIRKPTTQEDLLRAPIRLLALTLILQQLPTLNLTRPSINEVTQLLSRVHAALRRWTWEETARTRGGTPRQWHIDNEYHVQNMLWLILSPIFPDLLDEVYTEAFGPLHPRLDLCIPSLKLIIEVKFARPGTKLAKIVEEISADTGVYLSRPAEYEYLIAFVWDDAGRVTEHDYLRIGLRKIKGVVDAIVISRPAFWPATKGTG